MQVLEAKLDTIFPIALPGEVLIRAMEIIADLDRGTTPYPGVKECFHDGHRYEIGLSVQGDTIWCTWYPSRAVYDRLLDRIRQMENACSQYTLVLDAEVDPTLPGAQDIKERKAEARKAVTRLRSEITKAQHEADAWAETRRFERPVSDLRDMVWIVSGFAKVVPERPAARPIPIEDEVEGAEEVTVEVSRDAGTGEFVSEAAAEASPETTVTEVVKKPKAKKPKAKK